MGLPFYSQFARRQMSESSSASHASDDSKDPLLLSKELLESPLDSPELLLSLSSPKRRRRAQTLRVLRILLHIATWVLVSSFLLWALTAFFHEKQGFKASVSYLNKNDTLVYNETLPAKAMPVAINDTKGNNRWTVAIPQYEDFPLEPSAFTDLCLKSHDLARHLDVAKYGFAGHHGYYHVDENFMDVSEAEQNVFLPQSIPAHHESVVRGSKGLPGSETSNRDPKTGVCKRSLTYVLESTDAGFGGALMGLWLAYGLAMKEGRAFFVDDRRWIYGTYTTFFTPPPSASCLPPPEAQRLPCPHHAEHLLVSAATTHWTFGHAFNEEFEDPRGMEVQRQRPIFSLMRAGFEALFHPAPADAKFVEQRVNALRKQVSPGITVGVHVRRGDKLPYDQRFAQSRDYIPSRHFVERANKELGRAYENRTELLGAAVNSSRMVLATDDPAVLEEWEFRGQELAQDRIILATEQHNLINVTSFPEWTGEKVIQPWEGGFNQHQFWDTLGNKEGEDGWWGGADSSLRKRQLMGRAYVLDLAVVSQTDRVICTISSVGCRLLAVMMGWEGAIEEGKWINIDGDFDWDGIRW